MYYKSHSTFLSLATVDCNSSDSFGSNKFQFCFLVPNWIYCPIPDIFYQNSLLYSCVLFLFTCSTLRCMLLSFLTYCDRIFHVPMATAKAINKRQPVFLCNIKSFTTNLVSVCLLWLLFCANEVCLMVFLWEKTLVLLEILMFFYSGLVYIKHYNWPMYLMNQPYFRWTYTCIDLLDLIQTKYTGTNFSLQRVGFQKAAASQSFYVDAVYIGQTSTVSAWDGMFHV